MKAIRVRQFGGPEVLQLEEVPDPVPGPTQVLVRVKAIGINPVDAYVRAGTYVFKPQLPYTPGQDGAGVIQAVGDQVTGLSVGDRVFFSGTAGMRLAGSYAEQAVCETRSTFPLPANLTFAQGAAVGIPYGTAFRGLFQKARAIPGESVLVHGASGGVGIAAVQLAAAQGLTVYGTSSSERGRALVRSQGAHYALDHASPDYLTEIMDRTSGRGVDIILEGLADVNLSKDLEVIARAGRIVVIGNRGANLVNLRPAMTKEVTIYGLALASATEAELASIYTGLSAGLANGTLRPIVGQEFPLHEAARAHEAVMSGGAHGKIVLIA